jgi:hypothetical protein
MSLDQPDAASPPTPQPPVLEPLPPPPPQFGVPTPGVPPVPQRQPRAGELTATWFTIVLAAWVGIALGLAAVWNSSVKVGLSAWWLGPRSAPRLILISLIPFVMPLAVVGAAAAKLKYVPILGVVASAATAAVAAGDLGRVPGIAAIEFALAGAGLLTSIAAFSGMYRADRTDHTAG